MNTIRARKYALVLLVIGLVFLLGITLYAFRATTAVDAKLPKEQDTRQEIKDQIDPDSVIFKGKLDNDRKESFTSDRTGFSECFRCNSHDIHIGLVAIGANATRDAVVTIKSILAYRTTALTFHLLVDHASEAILRGIFDSWRLSCIQYFFYLLLDHTAEIAWVRTLHASGPYGLAKLTYDRILPHVDRIIAIDTDLIFTGDVLELWHFFDEFTQQQCIGAVEQQSDWYLGSLKAVPSYVIWPAIGKGLNSGVMLLHLKRMREENWRQSWSSLTKQQLEISRSTALADQDVFNLARTKLPSLFFSLPCNWNIQIHNHSYAKDCFETVPPKVLHWNSPAKFATNHSHAQYFRDMYARVVSIDGGLLRQPPLSCGVHHQVPPLRSNITMPNGSDPCFDLKVAAARQYRVHTKYWQTENAKLLFECRLIGDNVDAANAFLSRLSYRNILAKSAVLAQHRFFKLVESQRKPLQEANIPLAEDLTAICGDVSHKMKRDSGVDVSLATQLSFDRINMLPRLAKLWTGPISAAIYLKDSDLQPLLRFIERNSAAFSANEHFSIHCVFEEGDIFPVNFLRTIALSEVQSEYVFNLDIDFIINGNAYQLIQKRLNSKLFSLDETLAFIVPAFETDSYKPIAIKSKLDLQNRVISDEVRVFRKREWEAGHAATNYDKWFAASQIYSVKWTEGYEPYMILSTSFARYDPNFVGFGWNKITQVETLNAMGFEFFALPDIFIIHMPHAPSDSLISFRDSSQYKDCIAGFYKEFQDSLKNVRQLKTTGADGGSQNGKKNVLQDAFELALKRRADRLRQG